MVAGNHGLFFGVFSGSQGSHGEIRGSVWRGGNSQLTLDSRGPWPLSILHSEDSGTASSIFQRSILAGGIIRFEMHMDSRINLKILLGYDIYYLSI